MRGAACEAVIVHREQAVTKQIGLPKGKKKELFCFNFRQYE